LKSWATIERRLKAAAEADFVIALYNAASKARPHQLNRAFGFLRTLKGDETVTLFVRAAGTVEAKVTITTLAEAHVGSADMRTLIIVGASSTRLIGRENRSPWVYTPRSEEA
jgi:precorrin-3B C17-methyltransferase